MSYMFYPQIEPYPTTYVSHTYPEKGHHLHHLPLPYLAHKAHKAIHDKDQDVHQSHADVRETMKNFYIEVEMPGVSDKAQMHIRWTTTRTLLLSTKFTRPEIPEDELFEVPVIKSRPGTPKPPTPNHLEAAAQEVVRSSSDAGSTRLVKREPHITTHERQIGEMLRAFNFPVDVDRDNTHARLEAGLLRVVVPKLEHEDVEHPPVPVKVSNAGMPDGFSE